MSETPSNMPSTQLVEGFQFPGMFSADVFRSAINYKPSDEDIFIVTYPKCGTTWVHHTLSLILRHGEPFGEDFNFIGSGPFLEMSGKPTRPCKGVQIYPKEAVIIGIKAIETMKRPGAVKSHLPFRLVPWSDKAKYIYVTRNPKDACVSFFHHQRNIPVQGFTGTFDEFFEHFLSGDIDFGDYFDHLLGWYEHRNDLNVLFMTYEEMKENPEAAIFKMASFVDDEQYAEPLRKDRQKLENVLKYSSFNEMKVIINKSMDEFFSMTAEEAEKSDMPEKMKEILFRTKKTNDVPARPKSTNFVRKGIVGDWRNHFSEKQSRRLDEKFAKRTKDTEIANFWKEYM